MQKDDPSGARDLVIPIPELLFCLCSRVNMGLCEKAQPFSLLFPLYNIRKAGL